MAEGYRTGRAFPLGLSLYPLACMAFRHFPRRDITVPSIAILIDTLPRTAILRTQVLQHFHFHSYCLASTFHSLTLTAIPLPRSPTLPNDPQLQLLLQFLPQSTLSTAREGVFVASRVLS